MPGTITQARDEITLLIKTALAAANPALTDIQYDDLEGASRTDGSWARITVKHQDGGQLGFGAQKKRFNRRGTVFVQLFTKPGDGLRQSDVLSKLVTDAIEGKTTASGVWFNHVRVQDIGSYSGSWQTNVLADFSYDEVK